MIKSVRVKFDKFLHDTGKAILVRINGEEYWLAYYMFTNLVVNKKLRGHLSILTKVCDDKGIYYDDSMADIIIETHIPTKINKKPITDDSLKR